MPACEGAPVLKIFVCSKNNLIFYAALVVVLAGLIGLRSSDNIAAVNSNTRLLPIYSVETPEKTIAITFDSAWEDADTADILAVLAKYNAKATFFVTGDYLDRCGASAKAFFDAGHEIANHSDQHPHPNKMSRGELEADTKKCEEKILALTGKANTLYRSPYGEYNNQTVETINNMGYSFIQWDVDSLDYKGLSAQEIEKRVCDKVKNGSIVLFHTGTKTATTAAGLEAVLSKLSAQGYQFKTVSELIYKDNFYIDNSGRQIQKSAPAPAQ